LAISANLARSHLCVGIDLLTRGGKPVELHFTSAFHALADLRRAFRLAVAPAQLLVIHCRNIDVNVDSIHQRPGNFRDIALDHGRAALAVTLSRAPVAAGLRVSLPTHVQSSSIYQWQLNRKVG